MLEHQELKAILQKASANFLAERSIKDEPRKAAIVLQAMEEIAKEISQRFAELAKQRTN